MYYIWVYFHVLFYFNSKLKLQVLKINKHASFMISRRKLMCLVRLIEVGF